MRGQHRDARSPLPCKKGEWPVRMAPVGLALLCRLQGLAAARGAAAMDAIVWDAIVLAEEVLRGVESASIAKGQERSLLAWQAILMAIPRFRYWLFNTVMAKRPHSSLPPQPYLQPCPPEDEAPKHITGCEARKL